MSPWDPLLYEGNSLCPHGTPGYFRLTLFSCAGGGVRSGCQAICPDRDLLCAAELRHELEVVLVVFLTEECLLSGVSPLGDMVQHARSYHTCQSSHGGKLTRPQPRVKS